MVLAEIGFFCRLRDAMAVARRSTVLCFCISVCVCSPASCCSECDRGASACERLCFCIDDHLLVWGCRQQEKHRFAFAILNGSLQDRHGVDVAVQVANQQTILACIYGVSLRFQFFGKFLIDVAPVESLLAFSGIGYQEGTSDAKGPVVS